MIRFFLLCVTIMFSASAALAAEPALPLGLGGRGSSEPSLPSGLGGAEPALPSGLGSDAQAETKSEVAASNWRSTLPFDLTGFAETRIGTRLQNDAHEKDASIGEARLHLEATKTVSNVTGNLSGDLLYDPVLDRYSPDLESGVGWFDLREANLVFHPASFMDMKAGRQILTWGTGDLIFINDMFPKDWNSFFIGRDEEYLKAPSDAVKTSFYSELANLDVIYTPRFDNDHYIDGSRLSYFNGNTGQTAGRNTLVYTDPRDHWFNDDELAARLYRLIGPYETALYYYQGYWKTPEGQDSSSGLYTFPRLAVYGASVRGPLLGGIANVETGYYDSRDDNNGNNALVRNSEWRFLIGYEHELMPELTGSVQYYVEHMQDYDAYKANLPAGSYQKDENRQVFTLRLTQLLMNQNLTLSLFNFYSPTDEDGYVRPKVNYKLDDHWTLETGGNVFYGSSRKSFFGQFQDDSNIYASVRYGF